MAPNKKVSAKAKLAAEMREKSKVEYTEKEFAAVIQFSSFPEV